MENLKNTSYLFVPFLLNDPKAFPAFKEALDRRPEWKSKQDGNLYFLKFVADKINARDEKNCQCFHFVLNPESRGDFFPGDRESRYQTNGYYQGEATVFPFTIRETHLFGFTTSVGMLAFQLCFEEEDPFRIAAAQFYLKKVEDRNFFPEGEKDGALTFLGLSQKLMGGVSEKFPLDFFYYSGTSNKRANLFSYVEVERQEDYKKELFYLRHCYSDGYLYSEDAKLDEKEIYAPSKDTVWGITSEAAVCLTCPQFGREDFFRNVFYKNFNGQYLFLYVLALHQKYVLYMFLTKIGLGMNNDLETLLNYKQQLYEFETDFVFNLITEVPQYQNLYERMVGAFELEKIYHDVREPLISLADIQKEDAEKEQKKRDERVNRSITLLSVLSIFSAWEDSFHFLEDFFGRFLPPQAVLAGQILFAAAISLIGVFVIRSLFYRKR